MATKNIEIEETDHVVSDEVFKQFKDLAKEVSELRKQGELSANIIAQYKVSYELLSYCVMSMTGVFGLNDPATGLIRDSILSGTEKPMNAILKELTSLMTDVGMAQFSPAKKRALEERFFFFAYLPHVAEFYKEQTKIQVSIPGEWIVNLPEPVKRALLNPAPTALTESVNQTTE